jgi:hypothetical protein
MMNYPGITSVSAQDPYKLLLQFDNGEQRVFDAEPLLSLGRFRSLRDRDLFRQVHVSFDTIQWENGLDLDPEYLYERSTGDGGNS